MMVKTQIHIYLHILTGILTRPQVIKLNYQSVSNDNYLKIHNLSNSSSLINDESLLTSEFNYSKKLTNQHS